MTAVPDPSNGMTLKELILRLDAKMDAFITAHEQRHATEQALGMQMASDLTASAVGRQVLAQISTLDTKGSTANSQRIEKLESEVRDIRSRQTTDAKVGQALKEQGDAARSRFQWRITVVAALIGSTSAAVIGVVLKVAFHL